MAWRLAFRNQSTVTEPEQIAVEQGVCPDLFKETIRSTEPGLAELGVRFLPPGWFSETWELEMPDGRVKDRYRAVAPDGRKWWYDECQHRKVAGALIKKGEPTFVFTAEDRPPLIVLAAAAALLFYLIREG